MLRIGSQQVDSLGSGGVGSVGGVSNDSRAQSSPALQKSDSVSLSGASSLVEIAKNGAASRQTKLAAIQNEVRSGTYSTENAELSRALVESHLSE